jgi:Uma2 family endonuclease
MSQSVSLPRRATYEDLCQLPDRVVGEIVDGELFVSPRPALPHASTSSALGMEIGPPFRFGRGGPGGWWILDEPELHLGEDIVVPDLAGWRRERLPAIPDAAFLVLAPDWACEIISPSTERLDRSKKLQVYGREGVGHLWLINPIARTLEVLRLEQGRWVVAGTHAGDEVVHAEPFDVIALELTNLWPDAPQPIAP